MIIKGPENYNFITRKFSQNKIKILLILAAFFLYTGIVFFAGGVAYKDGIFGKVIKPVILGNINIPINYLKSLRASPEQIVIDIKHKDFQKLAYKRELALAEGVLHSSADDYVPAEIRWNGKTVKARMRLKGDLADHWSDKTKWSFRIKTRKDDTVLGMKKFSLQHPFTRGFLNDWYLHQLLKYIKGFIVLRYEFVSLTVNGKNLGIYLMEEHFDEMLLKNNKYINAPIIRIYDHLLWYNVDPITGFTRSHLNEHYTISPVDAFNTNTVNSSEALLMNFNQAKNLLESFRQGRLLTHQVFEIKKLAKLFAVIDLFGYHHSTAYSNIRFYYNPVTSLLEPIGYDNTFIKEARAIQGQASKLKILSSDRPQYIDPDVYQKWHKTFFNDKIFFKEYIKELKKISEKKFLDVFFQKTEKQCLKQLDILYKTFPGYRFKNKPILFKNQEYIRNIINPDQAINAYFKKFDINENTLTLELGNIQSLPVEIISATFQSYTSTPLQQEIILQPKTRFEFVDYKKFVFNLPDDCIWEDDFKKRLSVKYKILGTEDIKSVNVFQWTVLDDDFPKTDFIRKKSDFKNFNFLIADRDSKKIFFKPGRWILNKDLIIPEGYVVICGAGTTINLSGSAAIVSYSPLEFMGTEDRPIIVRSDDKTGQGIAVIKASKKSIFQNVIFKGLKTPSKGDWILSSAVTFYESPVVMYRCQFRKILQKDALSIIRSEFTIDKSHFKNIHGTALRVAFGKGKISGTSFSDCGKNGLHFAGSVVDGEKIFIKNCLSGGINAEESSIADMEHIEINNTKIAVVNTDTSMMIINNISISDCETGFAVYQKHPGFGPAEIQVAGLKKNNVKTDYLLEEKSILSVDGNDIKAGKKDVQKFLSKKMEHIGS